MAGLLLLLLLLLLVLQMFSSTRQILAVCVLR